MSHHCVLLTEGNQTERKQVKIFEKKRRWYWIFNNDDLNRLKKIISLLECLPFVLATFLTSKKGISRILRRSAIRPLKKFLTYYRTHVDRTNHDSFDQQTLFIFPDGRGYRSDSEWHEKLILESFVYDMNLHGRLYNTFQTTLEDLMTLLTDVEHDIGEIRKSHRLIRKRLNEFAPLLSILQATEDLLKSEETPADANTIFSKHRYNDLVKIFDDQWNRLTSPSSGNSDDDDNSSDENN